MKSSAWLLSFLAVAACTSGQVSEEDGVTHSEGGAGGKTSSPPGAQPGGGGFTSDASPEEAPRPLVDAATELTRAEASVQGEAGKGDAEAGPDPGSEGDGDAVIGPNYKEAPEFTVQGNVPRGTVNHFQMHGKDSKIFPGLKGDYTRDVWAYIPKEYVAGSEAPVLVVEDGDWYHDSVPPVLDNMIHDKRLPALVAVFVQAGGGDGGGSERGLEYDRVSADWANYIDSEVLPKVAHDYGVTFTKNPEGKATMGGSSGGAAAFTMGWFKPDSFRRILSYSGTFVNQHSDSTYPHGAWEYPEHLIADSEKKPLRVYLEVGENDNGHNEAESTYHNWVIANQRMAKALAAKGYHYHYDFAKGAGHVDGNVFKQTFPGAMAWLWKGYPIP